MTQSPSNIKWAKFRPILLSGLILLIASVVAVVLFITLGNASENKPSNSNSNNISSGLTLPKDAPDLNYPNATNLNLDFHRIWPDVSFDKIYPGSFSTPDDYTKIVSYYEAKLTPLGYQISSDPVCSGPKCSSIISFSAKSDKANIIFIIFSYENLSSEYTKIPDEVGKQIKPGSNLVLYQYEPVKK